MNSYSDILKETAKYEKNLLDDSASSITAEITGKRGSIKSEDTHDRLVPAIDRLLEVMKLHKVRLPKQTLGFKEQLEYQLHPYGLMYRFIEPKDEWYKTDCGPLIAELADGSFVLLQRKKKNYTYTNPATGKAVYINGNNVSSIGKTVIRFYRPLPQRKLKLHDVVLYVMREFRLGEMANILIFSLLAVLSAAILPIVANLTLKNIGPNVDMDLFSMLFGFSVLLLPFVIMRYIFNVLKEKHIISLAYRVSGNVQSAFMMRLFSMPPETVSRYSAGDMSHNVMQILPLLNRLIQEALMTVLTGIFSYVYLTFSLSYSVDMVRTLTVYLTVILAVNIAAAAFKMRLANEINENKAETYGMTHRIMTGMQKLFLSGAENRGFVQWSETYRKGLKAKYRPPRVMVAANALTTAIFAVCLWDLFGQAYVRDMRREDFYSFFMFFSMLTAALTEMFKHLLSIAETLPVFKLLKPLMESEVETDKDKIIIDHLSGDISMEKVTFRYSDDEKLILNETTFHIRKGEYVAIVGKSGCGKSTILRLLLGFVRAKRGDIYYNGQPLRSLDLKSVRSKMGVVLQNSTVIRGTIEDNIKLNAPEISEEEVWEAVRLAGLEEDVLKMPLRLKTPLPFGGKGMSGGQIQKILIARAVAGKPNILIFDEATSALDNISQKHIAESLDSLKCTRIVVAHRLSTVKKCDRILVLDSGRFVEEGTYDSLMEKNGFFAELVRRQQIK